MFQAVVYRSWSVAGGLPGCADETRGSGSSSVTLTLRSLKPHLSPLQWPLEFLPQRFVQPHGGRVVRMNADRIGALNRRPKRQPQPLRKLPATPED